jgi:site-specific DNA-cytosine methylase
MKYLSTFSGIGGFELGIQQAYEKLCIENKKQKVQGVGNKEGRPSQRTDISSNGLTCVGYSEIDKYAIQIYEQHFNHKNYGNAVTVNVIRDIFMKILSVDNPTL